MEEARLIMSNRTIPGLTPAEMRDFGITIPPTQDELPYSDGMPMESNLHVLQMILLIETLKLYWEGRQDVFVGGNMFVYFSPDQVLTHDFRGPDFFAVQGVKKRERKSWLVWEEGKGPDVVIELLSDTTAERDKNEKKLVYQDRLRVPEYFLFHPYTGELAGFALREGFYEPILPDGQGRLISQQLHLALVKWEGVYGDEKSHWLRWESLDGSLIPTPQEKAEQEEKQAEQERLRAEEAITLAEQERLRAEQERRRASELETMLARYQERFGKLPE
jgi:Uma2 family endonuclease